MSFKIALPPGVVKSDTAFAVGARWADVQNVRFVTGKPEKLGGCRKSIETQHLGKMRGMLGWVTTVGTPIVNMGSYIKLYAATDAYEDITPFRTTGTLAADPFAVVDTSTTVTVTHTGHGLDVGATVIFDLATAGGGITIDGSYLVVTVVDANTYTITHSAAATSTDATTGGAAATFEYEINPGYEDTVIGVGYGAGAFGTSTFGTPRATGGLEIELRTWFLQTWGNEHELLAAPSGGTIYQWDEAAGDPRATALTNAPTSMRAFFVTSEGYPTALGALDTAIVGVGSPMTMAWPDREDITDWTPAEDNYANVRALNVGNKLMGGAALSDVNIVWSDTATYRHQFLGDFENVYATVPIAVGIGLIGPRAFAIVGNPATAYWMSATGFHVTNGTSVAFVPNQDTIRDHVFLNMDHTFSAKFWAAYNGMFNEVWFGYVKQGDTEPANIAIVSLADFSWTLSTYSRTSMTYIPSLTDSFVGSTTDLYLMAHEVSLDDGDVALEWYIESGMLDLAKGDKDMDVMRYIHDRSRQTGPVDVTITLYERPNSQNPIDEGTFSVGADDEDADPRLGGRHGKIRFGSIAIGTDWAMGTPMLTLQPAGGR
jgi:hypothetical protein